MFLRWRRCALRHQHIAGLFAMGRLTQPACWMRTETIELRMDADVRDGGDAGGDESGDGQGDAPGDTDTQPCTPVYPSDREWETTISTGLPTTLPPQGVLMRWVRAYASYTPGELRARMEHDGAGGHAAAS
ncbi:MAG: hypothetical protein R3C68_09950 [Myxococcota bacterium]